MHAIGSRAGSCCSVADPFELRRLELERELGEPITVDGVTAAWRIFQRAKGHRHSTDDVMTGWYALEHANGADRCLDLGTGIGTVGLLVLSGLQGHLACVEAQDLSFRLLQENVRANGLADRVEMHHGDLRELALERRFPLVTGSPPYFDVRAGVVPADSQKAHARFELRGTVADYAKTARRHLAAGGSFVFCFPWAQKDRAWRLVEAEGFHIVRVRDVIPRAGLTPLFSVFVAKLEVEPLLVEPPFVVRSADGKHTDAMHAVRARFGWPPQR